MPASPRRMSFHWSLPATGGDLRRGADRRTEINPVADIDRQREFCLRAEELGITSLLLPIGFQRADPCVVATAYGLATSRLKFMAASRPGIISPTHFVQQVNTVSAFTNGRIEINVVSGQGSQELRGYGDFATHDERYQRTDEFWTVCHALWRREFPVNFDGTFIKVEGARVNQEFIAPDRHRPFVYMGGSSELARSMAIKHADCLLRLAEPPARMAAQIEPVLEAGKEAGIIVNLITAHTHEDAVAHGRMLAENAGEHGKTAIAEWRKATAESVGFTNMFRLAEDASSWQTPYLWAGLVPYLGPMAMSLVGSPDEIVEAIFEYRRIGITRFLFQARPDRTMLELFGGTILPKIIEREALEPLAVSGTGGGT
jgi:alkanesulfonate monooxygenase